MATDPRNRRIFAALLTAVLMFPAPAQIRASEKGLAPQPNETSETAAYENEEAFIKIAEDLFYSNVHGQDKFSLLQVMLEDWLKTHPKSIYAIWARARLAYFRKDAIYLREKQQGIDLSHEKLKLAEECHKWSDVCLQTDERNAECHMVKGACYAMEASTIGPKFSALSKIKKMEYHWKKSSETPSDVRHVRGKMTTAEMSLLTRGILYRVVPDTWWFYMLTGLRGNKEKAYKWVTENIQGKLDHEPMFTLEAAAASLCLGNEKKDPRYTQEGLEWIKKGLALPIRAPMNAYDQENLRYLQQHPDEGCHYRRERFEDTNAKLRALSEEGKK